METLQRQCEVLQSTSITIRVICKPLKIGRRGFADSSSPSAKMPSWDILFSALCRGRNRAEFGPSRPFFRTTGTGPQAHFGPFSLSVGLPSLTQPNHGRFGTDVRTAQPQWVRRSPRGVGSKELRSGGVSRDRTIRFRYGHLLALTRLLDRASTKLSRQCSPQRHQGAALRVASRSLGQPGQAGSDEGR